MEKAPNVEFLKDFFSDNSVAEDDCTTEMPEHGQGRLKSSHT
jgi:hypothetical protein